MKTKLILSTLVMGLLSIGVWAEAADVSVTVNGMVCSFCAQGITKKFKARPDVQNVKVDLGAHKVDLSLKDGSGLSDADITKILKESGYTVEKIERKPS